MSTPTATTMEILTTPDIYYPSINENGMYIDQIPNFKFLHNGLICQCTGYISTTPDKFRNHIKCKNIRLGLLPTIIIRIILL